MYTSSVSTVAFTPACKGTPVTASTAATVASLYEGANQLQIANKTSAWAHVLVAETAALAAEVSLGTSDTQNTSDYPVAPGAVVVISVDPNAEWVGVILDSAPSGSAIVVCTPGQGN